ncbi:unnamed protein product [Hydatigera taeniaeformis]|uniref:E3 ubiquitin-protein ligase n=1 Tax=Hydatigena taeniaeformis TaxID=6205 RepID=A0A158REC5_HYDTA|nr:unnamed protein product [Hydatigera taeniaeformis]
MESCVLVELLQANDNLDLNLAALEQLSAIVLQSESPDSLKKLFPPSSIIPPLLNFFLNSSMESSILETAARVMTYYLQFLPFDTIASITDQESLFIAIARRISRCIETSEGHVLHTAVDLNSQLRNRFDGPSISLIVELILNLCFHKPSLLKGLVAKSTIFSEICDMLKSSSPDDAKQKSVEGRISADILVAMNTVQIKTCWWDLEGRSLLASAVECRYLSAIMALVNRGSDPNSGLKETPMHVAASLGDTNSVRFLISLQNNRVGVAANPLLRNTLGRTPKECCKQSNLAELLKTYEEGRGISLMDDHTALRLITRVCRSCPGYAMVSLALKEESSRNSRGQVTQFPLRTQLLNLITSGLNQGCISEACQMLSLILALVDHPGIPEGLQRHGVLDFLSWRIEAEVLLMGNSQDGHLRSKPQCIYEISWDQTYQFGDWFVSRSGNSSVFILQEYAALHIEVKLRQIQDYPTAPIIFATLLTRSDSTKGYDLRATAKLNQSRADKVGKLVAKTIILCSSAEVGQIQDNKDPTSQWLKCQACIMRTCSCKVGVLPLPLKCGQGKTSIPEALYGACSTLPLGGKGNLPVEETDVSSGKVDPENGGFDVKETSPAISKELVFVDNTPFVESLTSTQSYPNTATSEDTQKLSCTAEIDFTSNEIRDFQTKINQLNRLTVGLLSLSISSSGLVVCLRKDVEAEPYLKALAIDDNEMVICNHIECSGEFDPDFFKPFSRNLIEDKAKQEALNQTLPDSTNLGKIIISPSGSGGVRFFGTDDCILFLSPRHSVKESYFGPSKNCEYITRSDCNMYKTDLSQCPAFRDFMADATPYEVVASGVLPALLNLFEFRAQILAKYSVILAHHAFLALQNCSHDGLKDSCSFGDSRACNNLIFTTQQHFLQNLFQNGSEVLTKKLIETVELFERYSLALPNFGESYEQLVQRSIYLQPKLQDSLRAQAPSTICRQVHQRKVDLSNYRIYTAPLVTFQQLRNWLLDKIDHSPWLVPPRNMPLQMHMDALENMEFMKDASKPDQEIHLAPLQTSVSNPEWDVNKVGTRTLPKVYFGGIFHWLSTNGGREPKNRANPARFFKVIKIITSDTKLNNRPFYLSSIIYKEDSSRSDDDLVQTQSLAWIKINSRGSQSHGFSLLNQPWIFIDTGVLLETSHYCIKVPMFSGQWPRLQHWKLLASSDRKSWDLLAEHHVHPQGQTPSAYWSSQGERTWAVNLPRTSYRFYWLISLLHPQLGFMESQAYLNPGSTTKSSFIQRADFSNFIELQNIEFYGRLKGICVTSKFDASECATFYHTPIKPGDLVVLKKYQLPERYLKEIWPPSFENDVENQHWELEAPSLSLGLALSGPEGGYVTVAWFKPIPNATQDGFSSCVVIERSSVERNDNSQPIRFIFPSQVTNHTAMIELATPDYGNPALQIFVKNISVCGSSTNVMDENRELLLDKTAPNSTTPANRLDEDMISQRKSPTLATMEASLLLASESTVFGRLILPRCEEAFRLGSFQFSVSFYGSCSPPLWPLQDGCPMLAGRDSSSHETDCSLTAPHEYDILTRGIDISNPSKVTTLDANLPGFVPPFDLRSGTQSQPATVAFDPSEGEHASRGIGGLRSQGLHLWLSWNTRDSSENEEPQSAMKSMEPNTVPDFCDQQSFPNVELPIFHCWTGGDGVIEEFPGCGRLKRPVSPTLSNCQRTFTLYYSFDKKSSKLSTEQLRRDNESLTHSSVNKLPFISQHSDYTIGHKITAADLVEQCLNLLRILYGFSSPSDPDQQLPTSFLESGAMPPISQSLFCPEDIFFSSRLRRKVETFMRNPWSVIQAAAHPLSTTAFGEKHQDNANVVTWCQTLMRNFHFLFPFSTRVDFWRITSLGLSRSIVWLQQQQQKQLIGNSFGSAGTTRGICSRNADGESKLRFAASDFSYLWRPSMLLNLKKESGNDSTYPDSRFIDESLNGLPYSQSSSLGFCSSTATSSSNYSHFYPHTNGLKMLGRLQREVASVPRPSDTENENCSFWRSTVQLLTSHAVRKQELEVGFEDEEGTGLGPTMEFYALISAELMRKSHCIWVADYASNEKGFRRTMEAMVGRNNLDKDWRMNDLEMTYVCPINGLFPSAWPANALPPGAEERFHVLGIALAKCLQDQRRMDLHFSTSFLKLLIDDGKAEKCELASRLEDFTEIYPEQGKFFLLCLKYLNCAKNRALTPEERERLEVECLSSKLSDLCLTMEFPSATTKFGQSSFRLEDSYGWDNPKSCIEPQQNTEEVEAIDHGNLEIYIKRSIDFAMEKGIRKQMEAMKDGFNLVFPLSTLAVFTPEELDQLVSGDMLPNKWTHEELLAAFEPVAGYTQQSASYLMLLEVLSNFTGTERKCFVRFVTGSPNLPPGGFRNLHPKIKVAKKDASAFGPYPSVNTCMHYLKLPEYDTAEQMREKLLTAAVQPGFFLN